MQKSPSTKPKTNPANQLVNSVYPSFLYTFLIPPLSNYIHTLTTQSDTTKSPSEATTQAEEKKAERGERTAENIRFGESISEHGFGGETVGNSGGVSDGERSKDEEEGESVRKAMGYGGGSGVGA